MKIKIIVSILLMVVVVSCVKSRSKLSSESADIVLYSRGDNTGIDYAGDNDAMYQILRILDIKAEFYPDHSGKYQSKDQTKEEIFKDISDVVQRLEPSTTLYWFLFGHGTEGMFITGYKDDEEAKDDKVDKGSRNKNYDSDDSDDSYNSDESDDSDDSDESHKSDEDLSYEELFDYFQQELEKHNKKIARLVLMNTACYSGSMISYIKQYQNKIYKELIVLTPVSGDQVAGVDVFFPELVSSLAFLKIAHNSPNMEIKDIIAKLPQELGVYPSKFDHALVEDKTCVSKISYRGSKSPVSKGKTSVSSGTTECSIDKPDIELSNKQKPTWSDLVGLATWLTNNYASLRDIDKEGYTFRDQKPQFYTYPENLKDEELFK